MSAPMKELWARVVHPVEEWVRSVRGGRAHAPAAPLSLDIGPSVPGWVFDVALLVSGLGAVLVAGVGTRALPGLLVLAVLTLVVVGVRSIRAGDHVFLVSVAGTSAALYVFTPGYVWRAAVLVLLLHLCARASWFASATSPAGRVEVAVLVREGRRFVVFNAVGQALALLSGALVDVRDAGDVDTHAGFAAAGGVALLGLAGLTLLTRRRDRA